MSYLVKNVELFNIVFSKIILLFTISFKLSEMFYIFDQNCTSRQRPSKATTRSLNSYRNVNSRGRWHIVDTYGSNSIHVNCGKNEINRWRIRHDIEQDKLASLKNLTLIKLRCLLSNSEISRRVEQRGSFTLTHNFVLFK